jgi:hypothetical protein
MAWTKSNGTRHTCNNGDGPHFGRRTAGCPRCDELTQGAKPREWASNRKAQEDAHFYNRLREHDCTTSNCNPLCCTYGDW